MSTKTPRLPARTPIQRFLAKFARSGQDCWVWRGTRNAASYGIFTIDGDPVLAHRFSYELFRDAIPEGLFVCHRCDNPGCVNPAHLFLGTQRDNMADMATKGRQNNGRIKLSPDSVREIRERCAAGEAQKDVALAFGLSPSAVCRIVQGNRQLYVKQAERQEVTSDESDD